MTTLSKQNLALLHAAAKTNDSFFALTHLKLANDRLHASNGRSLYSSPIVNQHADFPECDIAGAVEHKDGCVLLPADVLAGVKLPNNRYHLTINNIEILIDDTHKHIITNDLQAVRDVKIKHEDLDWPNHAAIERSAKNLLDTKSVRLSVSELETLVKVARQHGDETVVLTVAGPESIVQVKTRSGLRGYIMPCAWEGGE